MIAPSTVSGWKNDYNKNPEEAFTGYGRIWKEEAKLAEKDRFSGNPNCQSLPLL